MRLSGLPDLQTSRKPVPREKSAEWGNFPEAMLRISPGYRPADGLETRSPGKAR